jgi:hypothetical protein
LSNVSVAEAWELFGNPEEEARVPLEAVTRYQKIAWLIYDIVSGTVGRDPSGDHEFP